MVRKLNELYKTSVVSCQGLSLRLQRFFLDKQRLLDRIQSVTAEKLIFSHAVQTVSWAGPQGWWGEWPRSRQEWSMASAVPHFRGSLPGGELHHAVPLATGDTPALLGPSREPGASPGFHSHCVGSTAHAAPLATLLPETQFPYV